MKKEKHWKDQLLEIEKVLFKDSRDLTKEEEEIIEKYYDRKYTQDKKSERFGGSK